MKVAVYWNLHKACWSIQSREGEDYGRIIAHASEVRLYKADFTVRKAGRLKVLAERKKNVHAFVVGSLAGYVNLHGDLVLIDNVAHSLIKAQGMETARPATYNPYRFETFVDAATLVPINKAVGVYMDSQRKCHAWGIR